MTHKKNEFHSKLDCYDLYWMIWSKRCISIDPVRLEYYNKNQYVFHISTSNSIWIECSEKLLNIITVLLIEILFHCAVHSCGISSTFLCSFTHFNHITSCQTQFIQINPIGLWSFMITMEIAYSNPQRTTAITTTNSMDGLQRFFFFSRIIMWLIYSNRICYQQNIS